MFLRSTLRLIELFISLVDTSVVETHTIVIHPYLEAQMQFSHHVGQLRYVCFEIYLLHAFLRRENIILALRKHFGEHSIGR
jgi:hypothetical protein